MEIGDYAYGGIYAGDCNGHHIICSLKEYESPISTGWHGAVDYCKALGMELPTKEELNLIYELSKITPEQFINRRFNWYWSSTEFSSTYAWNQGFNVGGQYDIDKTFSLYVRAIQRVKIER